MNRLQHTWIAIFFVFVFFSMYCIFVNVPVNPIVVYPNKKYPISELNTTGRMGVNACAMLIPLLLIYPTYVLSYHLACHFNLNQKTC